MARKIMNSKNSRVKSKEKSTDMKNTEKNTEILYIYIYIYILSPFVIQTTYEEKNINFKFLWLTWAKKEVLLKPSATITC